MRRRRSGIMAAVVWTVCAMGSVFSLRAQDYHFWNYTRQDGLASNTVYRVVQDSLGFIWAATDNGLSRFDGTSFKNFSTDDGLPDNEIVNLYVDSHNRLWYCSVSGLFGYYAEGKFTNASEGKLKGVKGMKSNFHQVVEDRFGQLWFATMNSGLYLYRNDSVWMALDSKRTIIGGITSKDQLMVMKADPAPLVNGKPVKVTGTHLLLDVKDLSVRHLGVWPGGTKPVFEPYLDNDSVAIGFSSSGLMVWNFLSGEEWQIGLGPQYHKLVGCHLMRLRNGKVIASLRTNGAELINIHTPPKPFVEVEEYFLEDADVTCSLEDDAGQFWFATLDQGLFYLPNPKVRLYGMPSQDRNSITRRIWQSDVSGQLCLLKGTSVFELTDSLRKIVELKDHARMEARDIVDYPGKGKLLAADMWLIWQPEHGKNTPSKVLDLTPFADRRTAGSIPNFSEPISVPGVDEVCMPTAPIKDCIKGKHGDVWLAGSLMLIQLEINPEKPPSEILTTRKMISSPRLYCLAWGAGGKLYVAGEPGLLRLEGDSLTTVLGREEGLKSRISKLLTLPDSSLLISTHGQGLFHLGSKGVIHLGKEDGLPSNICNDLFLDHENLVWVGTYLGLALMKWTPTGLEFVQHPVTQILSSNKIQHVARKGDRVFASVDELLTSIPFGQDFPIRKEYPILLTEFRVNGSALPEGHSKRLKPYENNLRFQFVGLDYPSDGKITYEYRLLNSDSAWTTTLQNSIEYSQLPHGSYTFEVRALAFDGFPSANVASVSFTVAPYWYQTWAFRILAGLALATTLAGIFMVRTKALRMRNQIELRMLESEQKALRSQMNPHFIFNSLNSIQRFITTNNTNESIRYLTKFGRLMRSILDNSMSPAIPIGDELSALKLYLELETLRANQKFDYHIFLDPKLDPLSDRIPPLLLQPYVENAIWHGIMAKEGRGNIRISLNSEGSTILCAIEDDGIGRAKARELKGANPTGRRSHGMNITAERLALLNRDRSRAITVQVIDLHDSHGNPIGTRVELLIPKEF
jgi:ligand-binding sensor domain-containing protein